MMVAEMMNGSNTSNVMFAINLISPVILGVIGYLIKRSMAEFDRRAAEQDRRITKLEENTVSKEDWLREAGVMRQRLDRISEDLAELKGQNQAGLQIGAAVAAALEHKGR